MDRPLDAAFTRQRTIRRLALGGTALSLAALAVYALPGLVSPTLNRDRIRTAVVEAGPVDATISASGLVVPEIEEVITTPVDSRVLRILRRAGDRLEAGDAIVELDVSQARLAVEELSQDLAIKANQQRQETLALEKSLIDLDSRAELKRLELQSLRQQVERDRQLFAEGLLSQELLRKSELAEAQAAIELKQVDAERAHARVTTRAALDGLALETDKLRKQEADARRQLALATPRAGRSGVLTWVVTEEGAAIARGGVVARVADFSSFRVDANVSDVHAKRLAPGQPVVVQVGEESLGGRIASVNPTVVNGVITVAVALDEPSSPLLRSNLRVDAQIVTARRPRTLRVKRGPFATGEGSQEVFVVRGDRAVRTPVTFGLSSFDHYEIVSGLVPGDEVVISDMRDYARLSGIRLR